MLFQIDVFSIFVLFSYVHSEKFEKYLSSNWNIHCSTRVVKNQQLTLPKINIVPENRWLEDDMSFWGPASASGATVVLRRVDDL